MRLSERLRQSAGKATGPEIFDPNAESENWDEESQPEFFHELKADLHGRLIDRLDLQNLEKLPTERGFVVDYELFWG